MINFRTGNILEDPSEALVNTVNCVGVMGRGVALQFKNIFPKNFKAYAAACARSEVQPGRMFIFDTGMMSPRYIINFPTKRHWRGKSRIEDIESGLLDLEKQLRERQIRSVALPPLGSGLGGLHWPDVRERIVDRLSSLAEVEITVYEPVEAAAETRSRDVPRMSPGRAALVALMHRYLGGLMDPFVTLLELHKLMYFMQEAGEPLRLQYTKGPYGPYATNLRHVLNQIEGHLVSGYADGGDDPRKQLELVPGAFDEAEKFLSSQTDVVRRFDRVATLVDGFETPFGLELLATVHWVVTREGASSHEAALANVHSWNDREAAILTGADRARVRCPSCPRVDAGGALIRPLLPRSFQSISELRL